MTTAALARRWFEEVWNQRRIKSIDGLTAPDCLGHHEDGEKRGREAWKEMYTRFISAIPDVRIAVEAVLSDGNEAVVRWRSSGTHSGPGLGVSPTNRRIDVRGMTWLRFEDGKIVEGWDSWNLGGLLQSLSK